MGVIMREANKENEGKKKQGRKSEEGIMQIIFRENIVLVNEDKPADKLCNWRGAADSDRPF